MVTAYERGEVLDEKQVLEYTTENHWSQPGCILFYNNDSSILPYFTSVVTKLQNRRNDLKFYTHHRKFGGNVLNCYNKQMQPQIYHFEKKVKKRLLSWLKEVFIGGDTIKTLNTTDINDLPLSSETLLVLSFPGVVDFDDVHETMLNVKSFDTITTSSSVYFVAPGTIHERTMVDKLKIEHFPTVLVYYRSSRYRNFAEIKRLEGRFEVTEESIKLALLAHQMEKVSLNPDTLYYHMSNKNDLNTPNIIAVYTSSNAKQSYPYLHAYYRSYAAFTSRRHPPGSLFTLDIRQTKNSLALPKYFKMRAIKSIPFIFCVYKNLTIQGGKIDQIMFPEHTMPTPYPLEVFIQDVVADGSSKRMDLGPLYTKVCHVNSTSFCYHGDEEVQDKGKKKYKQQQIRKERRPKRKQALQGVTDSTWDDVIVGYNKQESWFSEANKIHVKNNLVIFISSSCSYCNIVHKEFEEVAKSSSYLDGVSVYLMNCTHSPIKCKEYHVTGYPTLLLFRTIQSEKRQRCLRSELLIEPTWVDYHGTFEATTILTWLADVTIPSMKIAATNDVIMNKDVRLLVYYYTKDYVMRYLPRSLRGTLLSMSCLSKLCELLHSRLECVSTPYQGVAALESSDGEKNLFVASVEFHRSDGKKMLIMKVGKPMNDLLQNEEEISSSQNSNLHRPHTYDIPLGFVCEDDHERCLDIIRMFIIDHSRLPIIHLTEEMFHTHQRTNNELWNRPILLALARLNDLNISSAFFKQLYSLSVEFYRDVNVAVLDVGKYFHWSRMFVPRDIDKGTFDKVYNQYPRFCFITMNDHVHAAFYPRFNESMMAITGEIDFQDLRMFVKKYLHDPKSLLVETEHF